MNYLLKIILASLARATLKKYRPRIVGITGSVGKTSAKSVVAAVLSKRFLVGQSPKNLNNEIGLPLAIIGASDSGYGDILSWLKIFIKALTQIFIKNHNYPKILVLEYGVDHVGDMDYLLKIARPETAIVTAVSPVHLEFIKTVENVEQEKSKLISGMLMRGTAILNNDDPRVLAMRKLTRGKTITYGLTPEALVRAEQISLSRDNQGVVHGLSFKLIVGGSTVPILLKNTIGKPSVLTALAGAAAGVAYNIPTLSIVEILQSLSPLPGRMRIMPGIKNTTLIDDTYNSSPKAAEEAVMALSEFSTTHNSTNRWAILGDMLELGNDSNKLHYELGQQVANLGIDYLVGIGERATKIIHGAKDNGFNPDHAWHFAYAQEAGLFIQERIQSGDVILIKGSQGIRCEKITKELMAEPQRAKELLVRQYKPWI